MTLEDALIPALKARSQYGLLPYGATAAAAREAGTSRQRAAQVARKMGLVTYNKASNPLQRRADGRIERVCEHGVGHTVSVAIPAGASGRSAWFMHGCDGCCGGWVK